MDRPPLPGHHPDGSPRSDGRRASPELLAVEIPDDVPAWADAGFVTSGTSVWIGGLELRCAGSSPRRRSRLVFDDTLAVGVTLDGIECLGEPRTVAPDAHARGEHPNGIRRVDHIVILAPSAERVRHDLGALGLEIRRERSTTVNGAAALQLFARSGPTILEIVAPDSPADGPSDTITDVGSPGPARVWGLATESGDLEATARWFGGRAGPIGPAVQPGRRILTLRHRALGMALTLAVMSPHHRTS